MKHEDALKLMDYMNMLGYSKEMIILTLMNCELGMGIGHAIQSAKKSINEKGN